MAVTLYTYNKLCDSARLQQEIAESAIIIALDYITTASDPETTNVYMKDALSGGDETILDDLIDAHVNTPLPDNEIKTVSIDQPKGSDGVPLARTTVTKVGWHYEPRAIKFKTGTYNSLHNRKHDGWTVNGGTDWADANVKFYNSSGTELTFQSAGHESETAEEFQGRLDTDCTCTMMRWQPTYDMDVRGSFFGILDAPANAMKAWVIAAVDLPAIYGGNVPFMSGGLDLQFLTPKTLMSFDGLGAKAVNYDPVYNSNRIGIKICHSPGDKISAQLVMIHFKG